MNWQGLKAQPVHSVAVCVQTPEHHQFELESRHWFVFGGNEEDLSKTLGVEDSSEAIEEDLCRQIGDLSVVMVRSTNDAPVTVDLWRGLTSGYELYFAAGPSGRFIVADNYGDLISQIPLAERHTAPHAAVDHLLFRTVPGEDTYLENVYRLGHGSHLTFTVATGQFHHERFDTITQRNVPAAYSQQVDLVDDGLDAVLSVHRSDPGTAGLFSGGVDSTLNQSYLDRHNGALNLVPPSLSEEWAFQSSYASRSAKLLGIPLTEISALREDMRSQMGDMSRRVGLPMRDYNIGMYVPAFTSGWKRYVIGERADALFGAVGTRIVKALNSLPSFALKPTASLLSSVANGRVALRATQTKIACEQLGKSLNDPWGYGALMSCYGYVDFDFLKEIFGAATVQDRLDARLQYVSERINLSDDSSHEMKHLELAHWVDYFCEDGAVRIRQLAHSYGKSLVCPYLTGPVVRSALSVDPVKRFIVGLNTKHLLKAVLKKRVPRYPVNRRKGITGIRFSDYYPHGDLSSIWEEIPLPDFLPKSCTEALRHRTEQGPLGPQSQGWHAVSWAIWHKCVLKNQDLTPEGQLWIF